MKRFLILFLVLALTISSNAQIPMGGWRDHLPYNSARKVAHVKDLIYCATSKNLFTYNTKDQTLNKLSRITGLSDMDISTMEYNAPKNILLIAYTDGNIDLIQNTSITNISDIYAKVMNGSKAAHSVFFHDNYAYLSYDFGVIVLDLDKHEIKDTYMLGEPGITYPVYAVTSDDTYIYAATEKGVFKADINDPVLVNYAHWQRIMDLTDPYGKYNQLCMFQGSLITNFSGLTDNSDVVYCYKNGVWTSILPEAVASKHEISSSGNNLLISSANKLYTLNQNLQVTASYSDYGFGYGSAKPYSAIIDDSGNLWIADEWFGLVFKQSGSNFQFTYPNGPASADVRNIVYNQGKIYASAGGTDNSWNNTFKTGMYHIFSDQKWSTVINYEASDFTNIAIDPLDASQLYVGSWNFGIFRYKNNLLQENFTYTNSLLQTNIPGNNYVRIGGLTFDSNNNLWISNCGVSSPLLVKKTDGTWKSFKLGTYLNTIVNSDLQIDNSHQIWMVLPRGGGVFIYNTNNTIDDETDDKYLKFKPKNIYGDIITNVYCTTMDQDGAVWLGTDMGPIYYSNPENVLSGETGATDGYQPRIARSDGTNIVDPLLGAETVNCIAVDGANRKWMGTEKGGAFLVSADGSKQIQHFNITNSPLFSNRIMSIAIDNNTGEVFFGTDKGIISYRATATVGGEDFGNVYVFPDPVREDYHGDITITGLITNTIVKITDISGNLVFETKSLGGQATWDGKNRNGRRVSTGVYLVFCSSEDGLKTVVTKMLVIH